MSVPMRTRSPYPMITVAEATQAIQSRLALRSDRPFPIGLGLVRTRVDHGQQFTCLDVAALFEVDIVQVAGHPRPDFDRVDGHRATGELLRLGHDFFSGSRDEYLGQLGLRRIARAGRGRPDTTRETQHSDQCPLMCDRPKPD